MYSSMPHLSDATIGLRRTTSPGGPRRCGCAPRQQVNVRLRLKLGHVRRRHETLDHPHPAGLQNTGVSSVESREPRTEGEAELRIPPAKDAERFQYVHPATEEEPVAILVPGVGEQQVNLAVLVVIVLLPTRRQCDPSGAYDTFRATASLWKSFGSISAVERMCVRMPRQLSASRSALTVAKYGELRTSRPTVLPLPMNG